jgi:hypothetical protein
LEDQDLDRKKLGQVIKKGSGEKEDLQSPGENSYHRPPGRPQAGTGKDFITR